MKTFLTKYLFRFSLFGVLGITALSMDSCSKNFLDVVPDNVATIDNAFSLRNEAQKYLFTLYSYLPKNGNVDYNIAIFSGDEVWKNDLIKGKDFPPFNIAQGNQRVGDPFMNVWDGKRNGAGPGNNYSMFKGIRKCNIFIKNLEDPNKVKDLSDFERNRWIGEAQFLKAYYHYYLLRMYGPIPIIDKNVPIEASTEEINARRKPFDSCVTYISTLLDKAAEKLPTSIQDITNEYGRATQPIALGIKAKLLTMAASPLFNGNPDYAGFVDKQGKHLMSTSVDPNKWKVASNACLAAIKSAEANGHSLYYFDQNQFNLTDHTLTKLSIGEAVTMRANPEVIWANTNSGSVALQYQAMVPLSFDYKHTLAQSTLSPPLKMAKMFYTRNGVPINEDKTLTYDEDTDLKTATEDDRYDIEKGYTTARLNFDREPRFYADLGFDGSTWYKYDSPSKSDENTWTVHAKYNDYGGSNSGLKFNTTGYYIKKLVDWKMSNTSGNPYNNYAWPMMRLADLYLLYAESLNEVEGPTAKVMEYIDRVRKRAGLKGVVDSWTNYSTNPNKYSTKNGMREIIHKERLIELAFEGQRFWDLRRWKEANEELNKPIKGWNYLGKTEASYYQILTLYQQRFVAPRDYLFPLSEETLLQNPNLVQNPGW